MPCHRYVHALSLALLGLLAASLSARPPGTAAAPLAQSGCSVGGQQPTELTFLSGVTSPVDVFWVDPACREQRYLGLRYGSFASQPTFAGHVWRVRDRATGALLLEVAAGAQPATVRIDPPRPYRVALPLVAGGTGDARRSQVDRPDDVAGAQVHIVYALPADGVDRRLDLDGSIARSVEAFQQWLRGQTGGPALRLDTANGALDITFIQLPVSAADLVGEDGDVRRRLEGALRLRGLDHPAKLYAVYYDGGHPQSCGGGAWPPELVGRVGALYLRGTPPGAPPCEQNPLGASGAAAGYWEFAMLHEIIHTLGFVAPCAPNHTLRGHVSDSPADLMYAGPQPWRPAALDLGRDDYFGHRNPGCPDLARSSFLDPLPRDAVMPPGWQ